MRDAARGFDGRTLFRKRRYELWDADMVFGCTCEEGWEGYNCGERSCPKGSDPLAAGTVEAQTVRTSCTHQDEIQRVSIGGTGVVQDDEEQTFSVYAPINPVPDFSGQFTVTFDTSGSACSYCSVQAVQTATVDIESSGSIGDRATTTAANLETALEELTNIDDVTVTGSVYSTGSEEGFTFVVTFVGVEVGGDVPTLEVETFLGIPLGQVDATAVVSTDGDEVSGTVTLGYDPTDERFDVGDEASYPSPTELTDEFETGTITTGAADSVTIDVTSSAADVKAALEGLDGIDADGLDVNIEYTGGPAVNWLVTFARGSRQMGNRALITLDSSSLAAEGNAFTPTASTATVQHGTWISGQFYITIDYDGVTSSTGWLDWNVDADDVKTAIESIDSALGVVTVTKSRHYDGDGEADDWSGGYDWVVTFRNIAENLDPMTITHTMDCEPSDASAGATGGGLAEVAVESRTNEMQVFHAECTHQDEVQTITIDDTVNTAKEVQTITISTGSGEPTGSFTLRLDTTSGCNLCDDDDKADETTINIDIDVVEVTSAGRATATAEVVQERLQNLANIDSDLVVTGSVYSSGGQDGYQFVVSFAGSVPPGDVPMLTMPSNDGTPAAWTVSIVETTPGDEVGGTLTLTFDDTDTDNYPLPSEQTGEGLSSLGSETSASIAVSASATDIETALNSMSNIGTVTVTREFVGGPGIIWHVTFSGGARSRGDRAMMVCDDSSLTPAGDATCAVTETTQGSFLRGTFRIRALFDTIIYETDNLDFDVSATEIDDAITDLVPDSALGPITVTRSQYIPDGSDDWVGGFQWAVTFETLALNLRTFGFRNDLYCLRDSGRNGADVVFDADLSTDGSELGEVNEIQLLECTCLATCSGGIQLSWLEETTDTIAHDASAADIQAALVALSGIPAVTVAILNDGQLCDADGETTAITFTHNPGDVPPLRIEPSNVNGITLASTSGTDPEFFIATGDGGSPRGLQGFKARQGTRRLRDCSGRGTCLADTATCRCFTDASGVTLFGASNNAGGETDAQTADTLYGSANCGYPLATVETCPRATTETSIGVALECSGRGTCSGPPTYRCTCPELYTGPACEFLKCPRSRAWFDEALETNRAHENADCANRGICHPAGRCICHRNFAKNSTHCSELPCPALEGGADCSNAGSCQTMRELASTAVTADEEEPIVGAEYTAWDADMIRGCACERHDYIGPRDRTFGQRSGWACDNIQCAATEDPRKPDRSSRVYEVQQLSCSGAATSGTFTLTFRGYTTAGIDFDAAVLQRHHTSTISRSLEESIRKLPSIPNANVSFADGDTDEQIEAYSLADRTFCGTSKTIQITFLAPQGDQPLIQVDNTNLVGATVSVTAVTDGTRVPSICSNRGHCDYSTGNCRCQPQFGSSDGEFAPGTLGDCAHFDPLHKFGNATANARVFKESKF